MNALETNAYLAEIVNSSGDAIVSKNLDGMITSWNLAAKHMFGYTADEAIGQSINLIIPPNCIDEEKEIFVRLLNGQKVDQYQTKWRTKDGYMLDVSIRISPICDNGGKIIGASNVVRNSSINHAAERASAYLAAIVACSNDAIISKDIDGNVTSWNAAAEHMYGYIEVEAIGQHISFIIPKHLLDKEVIIISKVRAGEKIEHYETVRQAKDGRLLNVSLTVSPIRDEDGKIIGASKVARDITERKITEEELRTQREWLQVTLTSIGDAVIATDMNTTITYLNTVAQKLTGWTIEEAIGKPLATIFKIINEYTRDPVESPVDKVIELGTIQGLANHTLLIAKDGTEYSIEDAAAPIRLSDGKFIGVVLVFHDIGDRRRLERELQRKADMLAEKDRRKDEFLAMLAHELRNPLAPISNALHLLASPSLSNERRSETGHLVKRQIEQMTRLLDDLLDVSRITQGKIELRRTRITLADILKTAIETTTPLLNVRGHHLTVNVPAFSVWIDGDAVRLAQVFSNLLNNAAKYSLPKSTIAIDTLCHDHQVKVFVTDNGIGIAPDMLESIFEIFSQVDSSMEQSHGGLGIGLSLVKSLIEKHDGTVEARSEGLGKGSQFIITLPIMAEDTLLKQEIDSPTSLAL